ncbi:MAG: hypothetical protein WCL42_09210 [Chlorobiaceae bacterium]|jgi:hypothetical protein
MESFVAGNVKRQRHIGDFTQWKQHDAELELGVPREAGFECKIGDHFVDTTDMITV